MVFVGFLDFNLRQSCTKIIEFLTKASKVVKNLKNNIDKFPEVIQHIINENWHYITKT